MGLLGVLAQEQGCSHPGGAGLRDPGAGMGQRAGRVPAGGARPAVPGGQEDDQPERVRVSEMCVCVGGGLVMWAVEVSGTGCDSPTPLILRGPWVKRFSSGEIGRLQVPWGVGLGNQVMVARKGSVGVRLAHCGLWVSLAPSPTALS